MPTLNWILETAIDRYWENQPEFRRDRSPRPVFKCSQCEGGFSSLEELRHHLSLAHPIKVPTVYVHGQPLSKETVLRSSIQEDVVELFHCSRCEVQVDGGLWQDIAASEFRAHFCQTRNATWNIRLVHSSPTNYSQSLSEYTVRFRIPHADDLNAVDEHFIRTFNLDGLTHADLERFGTGLPKDAPAREYGNALGDYVLGVILKERRTLSVAPVAFEEFSKKMQSALGILQHFQRPVALAVASCIRFNLNDFRPNATATATELEAALAFFRNRAGEGTTEERTEADLGHIQPQVLRPVCPLDQITHHIIVGCGRLSDNAKLTVGHVEELKQLTRGTAPVSAQDLAKIHVICAEGFLRWGRGSDATKHLREIQFSPVFGHWAQARIKEI